MGRILDLTKEQEQLQDQLFFLDETSESYQEEFDAIMSKQMANNNSLVHMLEYLSDVLIELKLDSEIKRKVAQSTQKRAITSENKYENLKTFIYGVMTSNNINKVEGKFGSLSFRVGKEVAFIPEDFNYILLPEELVTYVEESWIPKKNDLNKYLKDGNTIEGIALLRADKTLTVR